MPRLANISYKLCCRKLSILGFIKDRQAKGSHELWIHPESKLKIVVARHDSKDLKIGTLKAMLRQGNIDIDEFINA